MAGSPAGCWLPSSDEGFLLLMKRTERVRGRDRRGGRTPGLWPCSCQFLYTSRPVRDGDRDGRAVTPCRHDWGGWLLRSGSVIGRSGIGPVKLSSCGPSRPGQPVAGPRTASPAQPSGVTSTPLPLGSASPLRQTGRTTRTGHPSRRPGGNPHEPTTAAQDRPQSARTGRDRLGRAEAQRLVRNLASPRSAGDRRQWRRSPATRTRRRGCGPRDG
jgi:hypothetical protein